MTSVKFRIHKVISRYITDEYEETFKYAGIESVMIITNEVSQILGDKDFTDAVLILDRPKEFIVKIVAILHLMVVGFVSGTSSSTSGRIKIYHLMMKTYIAAGIDIILHPNAISS